MTHLITARPYLKEGENLIGYVIRLARLNMYSNVQQFVKEWTSLKVVVNATIGQQQRLATFVSEITGHSICFDESSFYGRFTNLSEAVTNQSFSHKPSICPACIEELHYIKAEWQFLPASFCKEHQCGHINICPNCKRELKWNVHLLDLHCQMCDANLTSPSTSKEPIHISRLDDFNYVTKLVSTSTSLLRPNDFMQKKYVKSQILNANWNDIFEAAAFKLESGELGLSPYAKLFSNSKRQHDNAPEFMVSPLNSAFKKAKGKELDNNISRYLVSKRVVTEITGISKEALNYLIEHDVLTHIFQKPVCFDYIFDIRDVAVLIKNVRYLRGKGKNFKAFVEQMSPFYSDAWKLSVGVLQGKIKIKFDDPEQPHFDHADIDRADAISFTRQYCTAETSTSIPYKQVARILDKTPEQIIVLYENNKLNGLLSNNKNLFVCRKSLKNYIVNNNISSTPF